MNQNEPPALFGPFIRVSWQKNSGINNSPRHRNSKPIPVEKRFDSLTVMSIAPLIARAITEVFTDGSVTSLFEGDS